MIKKYVMRLLLVGPMGPLLDFLVESETRLSAIRVAPTAPIVAFEGSPNDLPKRFRTVTKMQVTEAPIRKNMCIGAESCWPPYVLV